MGILRTYEVPVNRTLGHHSIPPRGIRELRLERRGICRKQNPAFPRVAPNRYTGWYYASPRN